MKHLILDCGGVLVYPRLGEWCMPFGAAKILGERARDLHTSKYLLAHRACAHWLDESQLVPDVKAERALRREYLREMGVRMDWHLSPSELEALADDFTDNTERFGLFDDVKPWLMKWQGRCGISLLSDTFPSVLVFMERYDILQYFDETVISCHVGAIKPDPRMYATLLEKLDADPADCLFVDDRACNLEGAVKAGMKAAQMARSLFLPDKLWDGPVVKDFAALNALMEGMEP